MTPTTRSQNVQPAASDIQGHRIDTRLRCRCCTRGYVGENDWRDRCDEKATAEDQLCDRCRAFHAGERPYLTDLEAMDLYHQPDLGYPFSRHDLLPFGSHHNHPLIAGWGRVAQLESHDEYPAGNPALTVGGAA